MVNSSSPAIAWLRLVASDAVGPVPMEAEAGGERWVAYRPSPGAPVAVVEARCPHRLVQLSHGSVEAGRLRCAYPGWEFGADGACALIPSNGPDAAVPPRARLRTPWRGAGGGGRRVDRAQAPGADAVEPDRRAEDRVLANVDESLRARLAPRRRSSTSSPSRCGCWATRTR